MASGSVYPARRPYGSGAARRGSWGGRATWIRRDVAWDLGEVGTSQCEYRQARGNIEAHAHACSADPRLFEPGRGGRTRGGGPLPDVPRGPALHLGLRSGDDARFLAGRADPHHLHAAPLPQAARRQAAPAALPRRLREAGPQRLRSGPQQLQHLQQGGDHPARDAARLLLPQHHPLRLDVPRIRGPRGAERAAARRAALRGLPAAGLGLRRRPARRPLYRQLADHPATHRHLLPAARHDHRAADTDRRVRRRQRQLSSRTS